MLESDRAVLRTALTSAALQDAFAILVELHQRRQTARGQPRCFASPRYTAFHRDVSAILAERGRCALHWLEIDSRP